MQRCAWVAGLCALLLAGCSSARVIESSATGGCVAISDSSDSWPTYNRTKAFELIGKQCPNGFHVVSEKEVVIGQTTTHNNEQNTKEVPIVAGLAVDIQKTTRNTTEVRDQTEYRIWYQKK